MLDSVAGCSGYYDGRARAAIVRAYRHALARLGEPVLRLVLLGLERRRRRRGRALNCGERHRKVDDHGVLLLLGPRADTYAYDGTH